MMDYRPIGGSVDLLDRDGKWRMRSLPKNAQYYLVAVYLLGLFALVASWGVSLPHAHAPVWELLVFLLLGAAAGGKKLDILPGRLREDSGSMSIGFAITFAAMLHFGPAGAVLVALAVSISNGLFPKRQPAHQILFNVATAVIEATLAGLVFLAFNGWSLVLTAVDSFPAVLASASTFFVVNTGGVAVIIALCSGEKPLKFWRETFLWTAPSFIAGAVAADFAMLMFGKHVGAALLFLSPLAYFAYQSYATYSGRELEKKQHVDEMTHSQQHLAELYLAIIKSLALAIDAKDQYTHQHILRVQRYSVAVAKQMGLTGIELEAVNTGALLHDVGKLGVPEYVLLKPGRLTPEEFDKIKKHPEIGASILGPVDFPWPVLPVVKHHHEKWDGTGYPDGLKGEDIPLTARILAVGDVYDALTSSRSYRTAWTHDRAIETIKKDAGTHFDPVVVDAFLVVIDAVVAEMTSENALLVPVGPYRSSDQQPSSAIRDIQKASSELWALYEVSQTLSSSLGLQEMLDILARKLESVLPGTACLFLLCTDGGDGLIARAAAGINRDFLIAARTLSASSRSAQVGLTREVYCGEYEADDLMPASVAYAEWTPLQSALIVPIVHQSELLGTINVYHPEVDAFGLHVQSMLESISERAAMAIYNGLLNDRVREQTTTDTLTGLFTIQKFNDAAQKRCDAATLGEGAFSILCLDVDSFKPINDLFGHSCGDDVLKTIASLIADAAGQGALVARQSGDEFLLLVDRQEAAAAQRLIDDIQFAVSSHDFGLVHVRLGNIRLSVSGGFACCPIDGRDYATLISAADTRMQADKTERKLLSLSIRQGRADRQRAA